MMTTSSEFERRPLVDAIRDAGDYLQPDLSNEERERRVTQLTRQAIVRITNTPIQPEQGEQS